MAVGVHRALRRGTTVLVILAVLSSTTPDLSADGYGINYEKACTVGKMTLFEEPLIPLTVLKDLLATADKAGARQLIVVWSEHPADTEGPAMFLQRGVGGWERAMADSQAVLGRSGVAPPGTKREGDGRTPAGIFPISFAFGYETHFPTGMPYRAMEKDDVWVDDPSAPDYNRLTKKGATSASSFEAMRRNDTLYRLGLAVDYNTRPVVAGRGSAIFIHIKDPSGVPTMGCVAFTEERMEKILRFLDPSKRPHLVVLTAGTAAETIRTGENRQEEGV